MTTPIGIRVILEAPSNTNVDQIRNAVESRLRGFSIPVDFNGARVNAEVQNVTTSLNRASRAAQNFGDQIVLSARRTSGYAVAAGIIFRISNALRDATTNAVKFNREIGKIAQTFSTRIGLIDSKPIRDIAVETGLASTKVGELVRVLGQAGLSFKDATEGARLLARTTLLASFDEVSKTTEGLIVLMETFKLSINEAESALESINIVSKKYAVESNDLITALQKAGGVFAATGGSAQELFALITTVRSATRESADTIATGFRTIFARLQRPKTIEFFKELNVELADAQGNFVGNFEAIRRINEGLSKLGITPGTVKFAEVVEQIGGLRQVSKVIPLLTQFATAQEALDVATNGAAESQQDLITAQETLAFRVDQLRQKFLTLFVEISETNSFKFLTQRLFDILDVTVNLIDRFKEFIPLLGLLATFRLGRLAFSAAQSRGLTLSGLGFNRGGFVPGEGNKDSVPALLTPGEFVINKRSAEAFGYDKLRRINRYAKGGIVGRFADGGEVNERENIKNQIQSLQQQLAKGIDEFGRRLIKREVAAIDATIKKLEETLASFGPEELGPPRPSASVGEGSPVTEEQRAEERRQRRLRRGNFEGRSFIGAARGVVIPSENIGKQQAAFAGITGEKQKKTPEEIAKLRESILAARGSTSTTGDVVSEAKSVNYGGIGEALAEILAQKVEEEVRRLGKGTGQGPLPGKTSFLTLSPGGKYQDFPSEEDLIKYTKGGIREQLASSRVVHFGTIPRPFDDIGPEELGPPISSLPEYKTKSQFFGFDDVDPEEFPPISSLPEYKTKSPLFGFDDIGRKARTVGLTSNLRTDFIDLNRFESESRKGAVLSENVAQGRLRRLQAVGLTSPTFGPTSKIGSGKSLVLPDDFVRSSRKPIEPSKPSPSDSFVSDYIPSFPPEITTVDPLPGRARQRSLFDPQARRNRRPAGIADYFPPKEDPNIVGQMQAEALSREQLKVPKSKSSKSPKTIIDAVTETTPETKTKSKKDDDCCNKLLDVTKQILAKIKSGVGTKGAGSTRRRKSDRLDVSGDTDPSGQLGPFPLAPSKKPSRFANVDFTSLTIAATLGGEALKSFAQSAAGGENSTTRLIDKLVDLAAVAATVSTALAAFGIDLKATNVKQLFGRIVGDVGKNLNVSRQVRGAASGVSSFIGGASRGVGRLRNNRSRLEKLNFQEGAIQKFLDDQIFLQGDPRLDIANTRLNRIAQVKRGRSGLTGLGRGIGGIGRNIGGVGQIGRVGLGGLGSAALGGALVGGAFAGAGQIIDTVQGREQQRVEAVKEGRVDRAGSAAAEETFQSDLNAASGGLAALSVTLAATVPIIGPVVGGIGLLGAAALKIAGQFDSLKGPIQEGINYLRNFGASIGLLDSSALVEQTARSEAALSAFTRSTERDGARLKESLKNLSKGLATTAEIANSPELRELAGTLSRRAEEESQRRNLLRESREGFTGEGLGRSITTGTRDFLSFFGVLDSSAKRIADIDQQIEDSQKAVKEEAKGRLDEVSPLLERQAKEFLSKGGGSIDEFIGSLSPFEREIIKAADQAGAAGTKFAQTTLQTALFQGVLGNFTEAIDAASDAVITYNKALLDLQLGDINREFETRQLSSASGIGDIRDRQAALSGLIQTDPLQDVRFKTALEQRRGILATPEDVRTREQNIELSSLNAVINQDVASIQNRIRINEELANVIRQEVEIEKQRTRAIGDSLETFATSDREQQRQIKRQFRVAQQLIESGGDISSLSRKDRAAVPQALQLVDVNTREASQRNLRQFALDRLGIDPNSQIGQAASQVATFGQTRGEAQAIGKLGGVNASIGEDQNRLLEVQRDALIQTQEAVDRLVKQINESDLIKSIDVLNNVIQSPLKIEFPTDFTIDVLGVDQIQGALLEEVKLEVAKQIQELKFGVV